MLKGNISSNLDKHTEEESSYVTLSNGPNTYVVEPTSPNLNKYQHNLLNVYFVTPILCVQCEDYIWGTGNVGVKCTETKCREYCIYPWHSRHFTCELMIFMNSQ